MKDIFLNIHKSALKFLVPLDPKDTYHLVAEEARKLLRADGGSILLEENGELVKVYAYPEILYKVKNRKKGFMHRVFTTRQPLILKIDQFSSVHPLYERINMKTSIGVPLMSSGKPVGVLTLHAKRKDAFDSQDLLVLELFASLAALAIKKAQLYDEVEKALEVRDHFISMAAHEFRTPLTTIRGYIQLLHSKLSGSNTPESRWVEELSWESQRLTLLINELLTVEKIKSGQLSYLWKECSLSLIIKRALADFRFTHPGHKVDFEDRLEGNTKDGVIGDFDKLLQVFINLLDNAAKFSPQGSTINILLESTPPFLLCTIKDQGKGIPRVDLPQVFERFYKGRNHKIEGMGLGLYLVKRIITEHKGKIKITSRKDKGVVVKVFLPGVKHD